jgi:NADH-quinone oxidoreductase subunit N
MDKLFYQLVPELTLVAVACLLFLLGVSPKASARHVSAWVALITLVSLFFVQLTVMTQTAYSGMGLTDVATNTVNSGAFVQYIRLIVTGIGAVLVLLAWPTNADATGSDSMNFGQEAGEFFALMLLSLAGVLLVADSNDIILLFLGIELASIPTYIMVSISRPLPVAQEAGVKYFFLGAMAAAIMLFGFSYLYGTTGLTRLNEIQAMLHPAGATGPAYLTPWQSLAVIMLLVGFAFKIAAVPLHEYAGDVYQGAATPVTAFLAFVPKTSGFLAIIKVLSAVGGTHWAFPPLVIHLLWVLAALTMTVGNALGLLQFNVKRVLAYSSVAHSGYMLVGITALAHAHDAFPNDPAAAAEVQAMAVGGVLFYLTAYGIMNSGAFGVLMMLPSREVSDSLPAGSPPRPPVATTAETYDDLAGQGKRHVALGLAMSVCCFSLIGIPLTVGFIGKVYLIQPALAGKLFWLVVITMVNAAISAAYYLKIIATMFLRPAPDAEQTTGSPVYARHHAAPHGLAAIAHAPFPLSVAVVLSVIGTIMFGTVVPGASGLTRDVRKAAGLASPLPALTAAPEPVSSAAPTVLVQPHASAQ